MRIIFMGTPTYAVPFLDCLLENKQEVVAVVTKPDSPIGRGLKIQYPPVKSFALEHGLSVLQPEKAKDPSFIDTIKKLTPDVMVVVGFGQILTQELLDVPVRGCVNVHFSLLPKYRGASPVQAAIINGEVKSGVTTMYMVKKLDSGYIIKQREVAIGYHDTAATLMAKLTAAGVEVLRETIELVAKGEVASYPQDETQATSVPLLTKESGLINWNKNSKQIYDFVRAMNPWPGAYSYFVDRDNKKHMLKIWETVEGEKKQDQSSAGVVADIIKNKGIAVNCGDGKIIITKVQAEGGKAMSAYHFALGHTIKKGDALG